MNERKVRKLKLLA